MIQERDQISDDAFRALLDWYMASDPFPASYETEVAVFGFLTAEANKRGYDGWVEAYHDLQVGESHE